MRTRLHASLGVLTVGVTIIATSCGDDGSSRLPFTSPVGAGGTQSGKAGHGGTQSGAAGSDAGRESGSAGGGAPGDQGHTGSGAFAGRGPIGHGGYGPSGDIGADAGATSSAGAPPGDETGRIFIGPGGFDGAPGTRDAPFASLDQAAAVARSGNTIVFLDGNYTQAKEKTPIAVPDGVSVVAENARLASLVGTGGTLLAITGTTVVDGIRFSGFGSIAHAASGNLTLSNATFDDCTNEDTSIVEVNGTATVALTSDALHDWGNCPSLGHVFEQGTLSVDGGVTHFTKSSGALITAADGATLSVSNLTATDGNRPVLALAGTTATTLVQSTLATLASNVVTLDGSAALDVTTSDLSIALSAPSPGACIQSNNASAVSLSYSHAHDCGSAIAGRAPATLTLLDSNVYAMSDSGLDFDASNGSVISITGSTFSGTGLRAARFGTGTGLFHVTVRGTSVTDVATGFELAGAAASTWDLGTLAEPGDNTLTAATTALDVLTDSGTSVSAVGNTWTPSVQDADGNGQYAASGAGAVLEVTSGSGQNYTDANGATLRLAENP